MRIESEYSIRSLFESTPSESTMSDGSYSYIEINYSCYRDIEVNSFCEGLISGETIRRRRREEGKERNKERRKHYKR